MMATRQPTQSQTMTQNPSIERTYRDDYNDEKKAPSYKLNLKLKPSNVITIDKLKNNETVPQGDVTRLMNNLIKSGDKETFKDISDEVFKKEKAKHPTMSDDKIVKEIVKRFKGVESKNFIRAEYQDAIATSGSGKIKTKKDAVKNPTVLPKELRGRDAFDEMIRAKDSKVDSAKTAPVINETKLMPTKSDFPSVVKPSKLVPTKTTTETKKPATVSDIFDLSSNLYKQNKTMVDGVMGSMSKENMESGSWLTELASLSQPEIKVINELMKWTPLGANEKDYMAIENLRNGRDSGLTEAETRMLMVKSMVNPDIMGKNIQVGLEHGAKEAGDAISKTWNKLTGHTLPDKKTVLEDQSSEAVAKRLETKKKVDEKAKYISDLMVDPAAKPTFEAPTGFGKTGGTKTIYDDKGKPISEGAGSRVPSDASNYFKPPDAGKYGYKDPTVMEDIGRWFQKAVTGRGEPANKEEYMFQLKTGNPELYTRYQEEMKDYNWKLHKSTLGMSSVVDPSYDQNKQILNGIRDANNALIKKARSLKQLTTEQAEEAYDINESLQKIMKGDATITFDDVARINSRLLEQFSPEVQKLAEPDLKVIYGVVDAITAVGAKGDSGVKVTPAPPDGQPTPIPPKPEISVIKPKPKPVITEEEEKKRKEDEDEKDEDPPVETETGKNQLVSEKRIEVGMDDSFPRLRPQLEWGGTDKLLDRDSGEYKRAENYAELMSINPNGWYNGAGNRLYLANERTDQMRFGRTYQLNYKPKPYDPNPAYYRQKLKANVSYSKPQQSTNKTFNELQRPIFTSQYPPMDGFNYARDQYDIGQFVNPTPKEFQTVYPVVQRQQYHNYFPDTINAETGGVEQVALMSPNEFIIQSRYRR